MLEKRWKLVIFIYAAVFILCEISLLAYSVNNFFLQLGAFAFFPAVILYMIGMLIAKDDKTGLPRILHREKVEKNPHIWLNLHYAFSVTESCLMVFCGIVFAINLLILGPVDPNNLFVYSIAAIISTMMVFVFFRNARNLLGMRFEGFENVSVHGIRAFAILGEALLKTKNRWGLYYLGISIGMYARYLKYMNLSSKIIEEARDRLYVTQMTMKPLPFEFLQKMAKAFSAEKPLAKLPQELNEFLKQDDLSFAKNFSRITAPKKRRIEQITLIVIIATGVGTVIQAIIPESYKIDIVNFIMPIFSTPSIILMIVLIILLFAFVQLMTRIERTSIERNEWKIFSEIEKQS